MFESPKVKNFMELCGEVGRRHGLLVVGAISPDDFYEWLGDTSTREAVHAAHAAAATEIGSERALAKGIRNARSRAEAELFARNIRGTTDVRKVESDAETDIRNMVNRL